MSVGAVVAGSVSSCAAPSRQDVEGWQKAFQQYATRVAGAYLDSFARALPRGNGLRGELSFFGSPPEITNLPDDVVVTGRDGSPTRFENEWAIGVERQISLIDELEEAAMQRSFDGLPGGFLTLLFKESVSQHRRHSIVRRLDRLLGTVPFIVTLGHEELVLQ